MWSVDTSVPLFGVKFTILFIACLILFIILVPFNKVLLFTRTFSYFQIINHFKPLLDAFQGPYKIKFYYWTGLQLAVRAIFFGISALDKNVNLMISVILLETLLWVHVMCLPFKNVANNVIEFLSLLNLHIAVVVSFVTTSKSIIIEISVSLTMLHLALIILLHLKRILLTKSTIFANIANFLIISKSLFSFWHKSRTDQQQPIELVNAVPEVDYNYKEFQEPLIGISK